MTPQQPEAARLTGANSREISLLGLGTIGRAVAGAGPALGIHCVSALVRTRGRHSNSPINIELDGSRVLNAGVAGGFKITVTGPPFATFVIETSVALINWNDRATNTLSGNGSFNYTDGNAPNFNKRYYRARLQ